MKTETIQHYIQQIDAMIATIRSSGINPRSSKELEALESLRDARLKLLEELEDRGEA